MCPLIDGKKDNSHEAELMALSQVTVITEEVTYALINIRFQAEKVHLYPYAHVKPGRGQRLGLMFFVGYTKKEKSFIVAFSASFPITNTIYVHSTAHAVIFRFHMFRKRDASLFSAFNMLTRAECGFHDCLVLNLKRES